MCHFLPKIVFLPFLTAILIFSIKHKNALSQKWCKIKRFPQNVWATENKQLCLLHILSKIVFLPFFCSHLEFLRKMQKPIYPGNGARWNDFDKKIFSPEGI